MRVVAPSPSVDVPPIRGCHTLRKNADRERAHWEARRRSSRSATIRGARANSNASVRLSNSPWGIAAFHVTVADLKGSRLSRIGKNKKADAVEHPEVLHHVGLLVNGPPGCSWDALQLVVRQFRLRFRQPELKIPCWLTS